MSKDEINGFLVDKFNQHSLKEGAHRGFVPCVRLIGNLRTIKHSVLLMIGNVVSVPVTTVILHFSYILINVRELVRESIQDQKLQSNLKR